jgi:hypothetical protein
MTDSALTLLVELLSVAGLAGLSGGKEEKVRVALTPLAETLEIGLARIPFGLTSIEAEKFRADLQTLAELLASGSIARATMDAVGLDTLMAQLGQTSQALSDLNHSDAFAALTAVRDAKRALGH